MTTMLQTLSPLPHPFYRLELSYFLPKFREVLVDMWGDVAYFIDVSTSEAIHRNLDCINDYGKDLVPILGYIDSNSDEFKDNMRVTRKMLRLGRNFNHPFSILVGMAFSHATTLLPLVFATKVYRLWCKLFENAANEYYENRSLRAIRDRAPEDSRGES
jgi:hypothetical protein